MYEGQGPDLKQSRRKPDPIELQPLFTDEPVLAKKNDLDGEDACRLHSRLMSLYTQELARQEDNRREMAEDEAFYDNEQWNPEDRQTMEERGQIPLTYNVIATAVDWVLGTERRMRTDYKILPRRKEGGKQAERKSQLLKYLADVNRTEFDVSRAFSDAVKAGLGWVEDGYQDDEEDEPVYSRYESWRNMVWDSASTQRDLSDCRYIYRTKWVDEDIAVAMFPDRADAIRNSVDSGTRMYLDDDGDEPMDSIEDAHDLLNEGMVSDTHARRRVRLIECWYVTPKEVQRMSGGDFRGEVYDPESLGHQDDLSQGRAEVVSRVMRRMHVAIMTPQYMLWSSESPYRHNQFPFTPIWGKVRGRDNMPYGLIRSQKDIQTDINKRAAKALHILSTNKVVMDEGAVDDLDEFHEEVARPDAVIVKKPGRELVLNAERELAPAHLDLMSRSIAMIQQTSGVTDENLGRSTNATSGRAIQARQDQGSLATSGFFDMLRLARQMQGEKQVSLVEQYFTDQKQFRITNMRGTPEYVTVNDGLPENDITRSKADFVISEESWNPSYRQAQIEQLMELLTSLGPVAPQLSLVMVDLIVESMDFANREELVKRIRAVTGQRDPDAEEPTPEEQQRAQAEQQQQEMQMRAQVAAIMKDEAQAQKYSADAQRAGADAQKTQGELEKLMADVANANVETQHSALQMALEALQIPAAAAVADKILHEAGFMSRTEREEESRLAGIMEGEEAARQQAAQAQQPQQPQPPQEGQPPQQQQPPVGGV